MTYILGIETSCDETAAAVVTGQGQVVSSVVASQLTVHAPYGGVVPELASRQHIRDLPRVAAAALQQAGIRWQELDGVAATYGPGLMGALLVGLTWAKAVAFAHGLPFVGVNHLEGHLVAIELEQPSWPRPLLGLVASGGHTNLYLVAAGQPEQYQLLAHSRDDAVGEAFDKVAKLLDLPYPGGPLIEQMAKSVPAPRIKFKIPQMKDGSKEFSYSGLKTAVRYWLNRHRGAGSAEERSEVAAAFQKTVIDDLVSKTMARVIDYQARTIALTGGVAANQALRAAFAQEAKKRHLFFACPAPAWCTDNAAMIAWAGAKRLARGERSSWDLPAQPNLTLD